MSDQDPLATLEALLKEATPGEDVVERMTHSSVPAPSSRPWRGKAVTEDDKNRVAELRANQGVTGA